MVWDLWGPCPNVRQVPGLADLDMEDLKEVRMALPSDVPVEVFFGGSSVHGRCFSVQNK